MQLADLLCKLSVNQFASGEHLAHEFQISRAAIWKKIQQLRSMGLNIEANRRQGYRLVHPIELLNAETITCKLSPQARKALSTLSIHTEIDSTNEALLRQIDHAPSGTLCLAEYQHAGRGRRGRSWQSPLASNLYFSILWRFNNGLANLSGLSIAVGVSLLRACHRLGLNQVMLKWPNDVVVNMQKLAGILIEAGGEWSGPCHAVIGIGFNYRMPESAGLEIDQAWTDLAQLLEHQLPHREHVATTLIDETLLGLIQFSETGLASFKSDFSTHDALQDQWIDILSADCVSQGTACGIDDQGYLRVRMNHGELKVLSSGDVSVRRRQHVT